MDMDIVAKKFAQNKDQWETEERQRFAELIGDENHPWIDILINHSLYSRDTDGFTIDPTHRYLAIVSWYDGYEMTGKAYARSYDRAPEIVSEAQEILDESLWDDLKVFTKTGQKCRVVVDSVSVHLLKTKGKE